MHILYDYDPLTYAKWFSKVEEGVGTNTPTHS